MSIECRGIHKKFHKKIILENITQVFECGKIHTITGPNGTGKTTLLRILAALEKPDRGQVWYGNSPYDRRKIRERGILYMGSHPYMINGTVHHNMAYPLQIKGCSTEFIEQEVEKYLEILELGELRLQNALLLSAGEKQKLALGRALIGSPKVVLMDEPTSNIHPSMIPTIESLLKEYIKSDERTAIVVTHDMEQSKRLADIKWLMESRCIWRF